MKDHMSIDAINLVMQDGWQGSQLMVLVDVMGRTGADVLAKNKMWIKPVVMHNRRKAR